MHSDTQAHTQTQIQERMHECTTHVPMQHHSRAYMHTHVHAYLHTDNAKYRSPNGLVQGIHYRPRLQVIIFL